jgi:hypothetical protein
MEPPMRRFLLLAMAVLPGLASAAPTKPEPLRMALTGYGSWAYQPNAPTLASRPTAQMMGCGGGGFTFVPQESVQRGRRGRRWEVKPAHQRWILRFADVCGGIGPATHSEYIAPLQVGYGGQWGGERVYLATQVETGLANYSDRSGIDSSINTFGMAVKPRIALGLQIGPVGVEVGPTLRTLVPFITSVHNSPQHTGFMAAGSIDIEFTLGTGIGPRPADQHMY